MSNNIGYKKLQNNLIAKLEIQGQNNENRPNLVDPLYAPYRCSKVRVLAIYHMSDKEKVYRIGYSLRNLYRDPNRPATNVIYTVGETITVPDYDEDSTHVETTGIHYFKTEEQAVYWLAQISINFTGTWKSWNNEGKLAYHVRYEHNAKENKTSIKYLFP